MAELLARLRAAVRRAIWGDDGPAVVDIGPGRVDLPGMGIGGVLWAALAGGRTIRRQWPSALSGFC